MASVSKIFLEEFIELFKNEPALWQCKSDSYKNKCDKNKSWNNLLSKYKEIDKDATIDAVKKKVNCLRTAYRRELVKVRKSKKSGAGAEKIYVPNLWYFNKLEFLSDQEIQTDGFCSIDESIDIEKPSHSKKPKYDDSEFLEKAVAHLDKMNKPSKRDEADVFAEGWSMLYRKMNEQQKIFAKRIIDDTLMHGQLNHLSFSSSVNLGIQQLRYPAVQTFANSTPSNDSSFSSSTISLQMLPSHELFPKEQSERVISQEIITPTNPFQQIFDKKKYE